jgi:DNA-binding NarL/FixJ family response regulator
VLLDCSEAKQVIEAFSHGARGVFCTSQGFEVLCKCIRSLHAGKFALTAVNSTRSSKPWGRGNRCA